MPPLNELRESARVVATKAQTLIDDISAGKITYAENKDQLNKLEAEYKSFTEQIADAEHLAAQRKLFMPNDAPDPGAEPNQRSAFKSLGQEFVDSASYKAVFGDGTGARAGKWSTGPFESMHTSTKTLLTEAGGSGGPIIQPDVQPGIVPILFNPVRMTDIIPSSPTSSTTVRTIKESTATNAAAATAEGGTKPESTLVFSSVDEPVRKVATFLPVTDEMLEDVPLIRGYIDARLGLFVDLAEDTELISGDGTGVHLFGFLNRSGKQTNVAVGGNPRPEYFYNQITNIRMNALVEPDAMVVNPADWQTMRLLKDANGQYYGGGPFTGAYGGGVVVNGGMFGGGASLWEKPVVVTPNITQGTALIGAFRMCSHIFRRGGLTIEASNSHSTFFQEDKTAIRAETRIALNVIRPAAFGLVTGL